MTNSNNAPQCDWHRIEMACGTIRQRLYVNEKETPWFVDSAAVIAHRCQGEKHGLWGAGLSKPNRFGRSHAECFGCGPRLEPLKAKAEQMALNALEPILKLIQPRQLEEAKCQTVNS